VIPRRGAGVLVAAVVAVGCGDGGAVLPDASRTAIDATTSLPDAPCVCDARETGGNPLDGVGEPQLVMEGFQFLEGPVWRPDDVLLFSDIPADTIYQVEPPSTVSTFRNPSGNANGLANDTNGLLLAAEHGNRRVSRTESGGDIVTVADSYQGDRLNSPNDIAVRSDGTIYFTDPPYGIDPADQELAFNGVFRVDPQGNLSAEWEGPLSSRPNGIGLSPDESTLYVADTTGVVRAYDVATDGSLSGERTFAADTPGADGMAIDADGNLFVTTSGGIRVFAPDGSEWGTVVVPRTPANVTFGAPDGRTLFITARQGLYYVRLPIPGHGFE
jgi:gluconolactonase